MQQPDFIKSIKSKDSDANQSLIEKAYFFALEAHKSQKRHSGDPYISHPLAVANILAELKLDGPTITTALLHDTIEDTQATFNEVKKIFILDKEVSKVRLDPFLETADVDLNNNYWPAKNEPTRFQMYKSNYKKKENPMQRATRAKEMENK